jgi:5-bromo-4-chloroindolyl phosphate hydrolysis protein
MAQIKVNQYSIPDDAETKQASDKASGNAKLKALGLTDDEIKAIKGIS